MPAWSRWAIVALVGKHGRVHTVPMSARAKTALDAWARADHGAAGLRGGRGVRA
ncbi:MAG: hypothetical protein OXK78_19355 [Caldilineaceae bacterium]|nr:hypothetical protein [Caldilineaceae bacterium]